MSSTRRAAGVHGLYNRWEMYSQHCLVDRVPFWGEAMLPPRWVCLWALVTDGAACLTPCRTSHQSKKSFVTKAEFGDQAVGGEYEMYYSNTVVGIFIRFCNIIRVALIHAPLSFSPRRLLHHFLLSSWGPTGQADLDYGVSATIFYPRLALRV